MITFGTRIDSMVDSIGEERIIVTFKEEKGISIIISENKLTNSYFKLSYLPGYPLFTDSIIYRSKNEYYSPRLFSTYILKDSTVICIKQVPIFHPNSNLRGQTPWKQPYINTYKRIN